MPDRDKLRAAHIMMMLWAQYGIPQPAENSDGYMVFAHSCMSAGEDAAGFIIELGLGTNDGWHLVLNDAGMAVYNDDSLG